MFDPTITATIIKNCAQLFQRLRKRQNDKETFDIVRDLQSEQTKLEAQIRAAESEVKRLSDAIEKLKKDHADAIKQLKQAHTDEKAQLQKAEDYTKEEGFSSSGGNTIGTPPGF